MDDEAALTPADDDRPLPAAPTDVAARGADLLRRRISRTDGLGETA